MGRPGERERIDYLTALCRTVPYHVVEAVLADPREHSVQPLSVDGTLCFVDLVGFTAMCERLARLGPDGLSRLSQILTGLFEHLLETAIFPYRGYVVHFGGDSITTVFRGADHARRAAAAALTCERLMHGEVGRMIGGTSRCLMLRIGLASGELRLPLVGDMTQRVVVCSGPAAHRALEMQHLAPVNAIMADAAFLRQVEGNAEVVERQADHGVLRGLRSWPQAGPIEELGARVTSAVEAKIALLEPFVPAPLAARLMTMPADWRIEGELRQMVILFAEVCGLDESGVGLELAVNVCRSLARAYRKFGGVISKADLARRGHRMLVLFGLHRPADNDALRAVMAALEATTRLKAFTMANGVGISVQTGIHAGQVYFGAIGSTHKHDITIVGDAVNVAARTASAAAPFEVLVTDQILPAIGAEFEHSARPPVHAKGKSAPLVLHAVHGTAEGVAHYVRRRGRGRFLAGRERELEALCATVGKAMAGAGRSVGLCGAHGAGKSAMLSHLVNEATGLGAVGLLGRCRYATRSAPLAPVTSMFASFLGLAPGDTEIERRERIRAGLAPFHLDGGAPELIALLQPVWRPDGTTEAQIDLADSDAREAVLASILQFVSKRLEAESLLYILEDLHLADSLTLGLAGRLLRAPLAGRFLFVVTYRPDPVLAPVRRHLGLELSLDDLPIKAVEALVGHELGVTRVDPELLVFLWQRTGGNPGHVVEIVRFLAERALVRVQGDAVLPPAPGLALLDDVVPTTLAQVTMARLDELGAAERRVLRVASAIGRRFGRGILELAAAVDANTDFVDDAVATLQGQGVIVASTHEREGYMFRDSITRAVAYRSIPEAERRALHRRIADAMQGHTDALGQTMAMIALHRERAGQPVEAAACYERAARLALKAGLEKEAIDMAERFEREVAKIPVALQPAPDVRARMAMLRFVATARRGLVAESLRLGRQILTEHAKDVDAAERVSLDYGLGIALMQHAEPGLARQRLQRVFAVAADGAQRSDAARLLARLATAAGDREDAATWLARAKPLAEGDLRRARLALARAEYLLAQGDGDAALALAEAERQGAAGRKQSVLVLECMVAVGRGRLLCDRLPLAQQALADGLALARVLCRPQQEATLQLLIGAAHLAAGAVDRAERALEVALGQAIEIGDQCTVIGAKAHLGAAIAWSRDPTAGVAMCRQGLEAAIAAGLKDVEVAAALHLVKTARQVGDAALATFAAALVCRNEDHIRAPLYRRWAEKLELLAPPAPAAKGAE
ncbi:MAG: AAA family ATPase [Deltaproteobacteria bacterium]|nr:AAA family ATPase [Deltaproteobacteria bacterium]